MRTLGVLSQAAVGVELAGRWQIIEVGVLEQDVQAIVGDRAVGEATDQFEEITVEEVAVAGIRGRQVEATEKTPVGIDLVTQGVAPQPGVALAVAAIFASELEVAGIARVFVTIAHAAADSAALQIAGQRVVDVAGFGAQAVAPTLVRCQVQAKGVGQAAHPVAMLQAFLAEHRDRIAVSAACAGGQNALPAAVTGVGAIGVELVIEIQIGAVIHLVVTAEQAAGAAVAGRGLAAYLEAFVDAALAADTEAVVAAPRATAIDCALHVAVGRPVHRVVGGVRRVVGAYLHVGALAVFVEDITGAGGFHVARAGLDARRQIPVGRQFDHGIHLGRAVARQAGVGLVDLNLDLGGLAGLPADGNTALCGIGTAGQQAGAGEALLAFLPVEAGTTDLVERQFGKIDRAFNASCIGAAAGAADTVEVVTAVN